MHCNGSKLHCVQGASSSSASPAAWCRLRAGLGFPHPIKETPPACTSSSLNDGLVPVCAASLAKYLLAWICLLDPRTSVVGKAGEQGHTFHGLWGFCFESCVWSLGVNCFLAWKGHWIHSSAISAGESCGGWEWERGQIITPGKPILRRKSRY